MDANLPRPLPMAAFAPPTLAALSPTAARFVLALRLAVILEQRGCDALTPLTQRLGSARMAAAMIDAAATVGRLWPDRFCLSPPCCSRVSHNEMLLGELADHAARRDTRAFHATARDYLSDARAASLYAALQPIDALC